MNFTLEDNDTPSVLVLSDDGERIGSLDFHRRDDGLFVIEYIQVSPRRRGEGLARKLLDHFVEIVRHEKATLVSRCGVAAAMLKGDPRYDDVR